MTQGHWSLLALVGEHGMEALLRRHQGIVWKNVPLCHRFTARVLLLHTPGRLRNLPIPEAHDVFLNKHT